MLPDIHDQHRAEAGDVSRLMQVDPVVGEAPRNRVEVGGGPAHPPHLSNRDKVLLPVLMPYAARQRGVQDALDLRLFLQPLRDVQRRHVAQARGAGHQLQAGRGRHQQLLQRLFTAQQVADVPGGSHAQRDLRVGHAQVGIEQHDAVAALAEGTTVIRDAAELRAYQEQHTAEHAKLIGMLNLYETHITYQGQIIQQLEQRVKQTEQRVEQTEQRLLQAEQQANPLQQRQYCQPKDQSSVHQFLCMEHA